MNPLASISHPIIYLLISLYLSYISTSFKYSLFTLHITFALVAILFALPSALYYIKYKYIKYRLLYHSLFQTLFAILLVLTFVIEYIIKNTYNKSHFTTYHSWVAIVSIIIILLQVISSWLNMNPYFTPKERENYIMMHRYSGYFVMLACTITISLGWYQMGMSNIDNITLIVSYIYIFGSLF